MTKSWSIELSPRALRMMRKLDPVIRRQVQGFLDQLPSYSNPRVTGTALTGGYRRFWRYRVGDHRVICELFDHKMVVWVVGVGHRREVYRS